MAGDKHWVGTWTTSPVVTEGLAFANQTLRMIARISIGGASLRVRLSNACGLKKLMIGGAHVALRDKDARIVAGSGRKLTFGGADGVVIPAGALAVSDPVALDVPALADLAVSVHVPGEWPENFPITGHGNCHQTNYVSPPGDFTASVSMPVQATTENWYLVTGIEVLAPRATGGIVAFGDSLTDANLSTLDANMRWPDQLARRLVARRGGRMLGVMNHGIGGNRILDDMRGDSGLRRFDRDALAQTGATHVIVFLGTNDLRNRNAKPEEEVTAAQMIAGLQQLAARAQTGGLKIYGCTLLPYENETFLPGAWTPARDRHRLAVNEWIRESRAFDAVIDFERTLRDPAHPTSMLPAYDCGDHLHPGDLGYTTLGDSIDLDLFD
ncbi:MAG TPA: SGNH/GDSL hydrolase family protein [Stellaceae bacterium]|nr:SGNH/GDSL hydrolase family protein [Stellaceae bacterium]